MKKLIGLLLFTLLVLTGCAFGGGTAEKNMDYQEKTGEEVRSLATIETSMGAIKVRFFDSDAPKTVANFKKLADSDFYNGTTFHRVIPDFMIQAGDPNSRLEDRSLHGKGGPGYVFEDEINEHKIIRGTMAMANAGPNTNGSQFFIVTAEATPWLDGRHTAFGEVVSGMEIVDKIEGVETDGADNPLEPITITSVTFE